MEEMIVKLWEDHGWGGVLFCTDAAEQHLGKTFESPLGRVPKMLPDRTVSEEGRGIHDMRLPSAGGSKLNHPPALQARHSQVAREALWWATRHPGIPRRVAKRDVRRAFKWHELEPSACEDFATRIPVPDKAGESVDVIAISTAMTFGWNGSPGEYMIFSWGAKWHHASMRPAEPRFNDEPAFRSLWLMDDGVVVEAMVGVRPWLSLDQLDHSMMQVWGPDCVHEEKKLEEGTPESMQLLWGLEMDVNALWVGLPAPKCVKASYLLATPQLQSGRRDVPLKLCQELRGSGEFWSVAQPALKPELAVIDRMMSGAAYQTGRAGPTGTPEQCEAAWLDWDRLLELLRVMFDDPLQWRSTFGAAFARMLTVEEQLALPDQRVWWVGGDATTERLGALDWGNPAVGVAILDGRCRCPGGPAKAGPRLHGAGRGLHSDLGNVGICRPERGARPAVGRPFGDLRHRQHEH